MTNYDPASMKKIFCNQCSRQTNHFLKGNHTNQIVDEDTGLVEELVYSLWVCAGCEFGTMEERYNIGTISLPDEGPVFDLEEYHYEYHPPRAMKRRKSKQFSKLNEKLGRMYRESVDCFNIGAYVLCAAGLRSLLEGICQDKKVKGRNLEERIDNLEFLLPNKNIIRHLHHFRFTGNRAMHELEAPNPDDVALALDVIEDLMSFFYELDYKASKLKIKRSRRRIHRPKKQQPTAAAPHIATTDAIKIH